ncbi:hypothetical protein LINPERHAP2_LOCUS42850 [Linum perenne]
MLKCGSKQAVKRIIALRRWRFGDVNLQFDEWIPEAGRSNVLFEEDKVWVTIRGISLHLRSKELFQQLGEVCGTFLKFEEGVSLSSVRLWIKLKVTIPLEIPISYNGMIFPVRVEPDSVISSI